MTGKIPGQRKISSEDSGGIKDAVKWPLDYRMQNPAKERYWSHSLYRGPEDKVVEVLYSKDQERSEVLAKMFLNEPVIGFDMEWIWNADKRTRLQENIGLIQIACEDKIALIHIGLHKGTTSKEIIAPSLRKLIENPAIAKTGVSILRADFHRLRKYFGLNPRGALELSHLHSLVNFTGKASSLTKKLVALAAQVQEHLGLPLSKGPVRTSNWSRALNPNQITYAAADAYAGFMLFHCMNAKRMAMDPTPPLPIFADSYPKIGHRGGICLHPLEEGGEAIMAEAFFNIPAEDEKADDKPDIENPANPEPLNILKQTKKPLTKAKVQAVSLDAVSKVLYDRLSENRKALAMEQNVKPYMIASNATLEGLAHRRPLTQDELLEVKGIGERKQAAYGAEWLTVITQFLSSEEATVATIQEPKTPIPNPRRQKIQPDDMSGSSSPAFEAPVQRTPQLHTGISFGMALASLDAGNHGNLPTTGPETVSAASDSDDSSTFVTPPSRPVSERKRKRTEPQTEHRQPPPPPTKESPQPLSPQTKIFRNKMVAFSKLVARKMPSRSSDADPIVSEQTLDHIVTMPPRTIEDLQRIPGIEGFKKACEETGTDLLKNIVKFTPAKT
ncbi:hypothetical protein P280DRAFT_388152 [Massarina eburnea CBS 473.64]|uniref:HRDC domain-containing protein n=1 Tax=Massarina eburnea CBS 473.64 TaxID=1395130 RepID=A0A6A6SHZ5_9PLEO|nr:hypothetical protein P280DRAFT_388152 [Massarina eburnea CBS 473.64]